MRNVFADTVYWVAIVKRGDPYEAAAAEARQALGPCILVTTDKVLDEFVTAHRWPTTTIRAESRLKSETSPLAPPFLAPIGPTG
jgi:hypothetical protein